MRKPLMSVVKVKGDFVHVETMHGEEYWFRKEDVFTIRAVKGKDSADVLVVRGEHRQPVTVTRDQAAEIRGEK